MNSRVFYTALLLVASLATALVYGAGGVLADQRRHSRSARCSRWPPC